MMVYDIIDALSEAELKEKRFRAIKHVPGIPLEATGSNLVYGVKHLPITFAPGKA
jgi:hypothetical protein